MNHRTELVRDRAIARAEENGEANGQDEQEMINAIFEMRDTVVREVMIPRIDMVCAEATTTVLEAVKVIAEGGHSRIPIYNKTIDDIRGILHARDLFGFVQEGGLDAGIGLSGRHVCVELFGGRWHRCSPRVGGRGSGLIRPVKHNEANSATAGDAWPGCAGRMARGTALAR